MSRKKPLTVSPGKIIRVYTETEAAKLTADWIAVFCKGRKGASNESFLWHVFSGGRYPSIEGNAALNRYKAQVGTEFVVLCNDRKIAFLTDRLPESASLFDYYVFPPNLAWTMAFTHEAGWLGPYFARHRDAATLDRDNEAAVRKVQKAETARRKGWV